MTIQDVIDRLELLKKHLGPDAMVVLRTEDRSGRVRFTALERIGKSVADENDGLGLAREVDVVSIELVR